MRRRVHGHDKGITAQDLENSSQLFCDGDTVIIVDNIAAAQIGEKEVDLILSSGEKLRLPYDTRAKAEAAFSLLLTKCYTNADEAGY